MRQYCPNCGYPNHPEVRFCRYCGIWLMPESYSDYYEPKTSSKPIPADIPEQTPYEQKIQKPKKKPLSQHPPYYHPYPYPYGYPPPKKSSDLTRVLAGLVVLPSFLFLGIVLMINVLSLFVGSQIVFSSTSLANASFFVVYPWPNYVYPITISGIFLTGWYIFIIITIVVSIIWLFKTEWKDFVQIFRSSARKFHPPPFKANNSFIIIAQLFFTLLFFHLFISIIFTLFGVPIKAPEVDSDPELWEPFFYLANASVAEEIFTRIVYIGLPLLAFDFFVRKRTQKVYRYLVGGGFKIEHITIILIVLSSTVFGLAHYPSWGLWKVVPTFVAGLGFGYLFVKKGIHTAVILHFLIDYMFVILLITGNNLGFLLIAFIILGLIMLFWLSAGAIYFALYVHRMFEFTAEYIFGYKPKPEPTPTAPPEPRYAPFAPQRYYEYERWYPQPYHYYEYSEPPAYPTYAPPSPYERYPPEYEHDPDRRMPTRELEPTEDKAKTRKKPQERPRNKMNKCPYCHNRLIYFTSTKRYYCEHCLKYID